MAALTKAPVSLNRTQNVIRSSSSSSSISNSNSNSSPSSLLKLLEIL